MLFKKLKDSMYSSSICIETEKLDKITTSLSNSLTKVDSVNATLICEIVDVESIRLFVGNSIEIDLSSLKQYNFSIIQNNLQCHLKSDSIINNININVFSFMIEELPICTICLRRLVFSSTKVIDVNAIHISPLFTGNTNRCYACEIYGNTASEGCCYRC